MVSRPKHNFRIIFLCINISILFFEPIVTYSSQTALGPLIYTPNNSIKFYAGSPPIITWYIISDNPDIYWITLGEAENTTSIRDKGVIYNGTIWTSVIKFQPTTLPVGSYVLTLYVQDYSSKIGNSSVSLTIIPATPNTYTGATPFPLFFSLLTLFMVSGIMIKYRNKSRNKKD